MQQVEGWDYLIKLLVVGPSKSGKSSLIRRFIMGEEGYATNPMNNEDFFVKNIVSPYTSKTVRLQVFEYSGLTGTESLYRGVDGAIVVYDCTDNDAQRTISDYFDLIHRYSPHNVKALLVATKTDLRACLPSSIQYRTDILNQKDYLYAETSAKENLGVDAAFFKIIRSIEQEFASKQKNNNDNTSEIIGDQPIQKRKLCVIC